LKEIGSIQVGWGAATKSNGADSDTKHQATEGLFRLEKDGVEEVDSRGERVILIERGKIAGTDY
jgi:hypothetical protein